MGTERPEVEDAIEALLDLFKVPPFGELRLIRQQGTLALVKVEATYKPDDLGAVVGKGAA